MRQRALAIAAVGWLMASPSAAPGDLQGIWTGGTITPFERPVALGEKAYYTEAEIAQEDRAAAGRRASRVRRPGDVGSDNEAFVDTGYRAVSTRQTSLIVDPPDGRIPFLPDAERRRDFNVASVDDCETMSPWDRCITRSPTSLFPAGYNNGYQIVQTPTHVVIMTEMIHEARIIPLDGRPHLDSRLGLWAGDSRGRWEGSTLVVETTNSDLRIRLPRGQSGDGADPARRAHARRAYPVARKARISSRFAAASLSPSSISRRM